MPVRSASLARVRLSGVQTDVALYTTPADTRTIAKYVTLANVSANVKNILLSVSGGGTRQRWWIGTLAANTAVQIEPWIVTNAGEKLDITTDATGNLDVIISGTELAL